MKTKLSFIPMIALALLTSCKNDDDTTTPVITSQGAFVVNEGSFGSGNASISYVDFTTGVISNNVFESTNSYPLGDVAQSMLIHNDKGFIVVNNSQKVEVVNSNDLTSIATITGFSSPRYILIAGNKGYVTDWFSNTVRVVDMNSYSIIKSIPTGNGPEQMLFFNNKLYVTNVGGFGNDSTVTVISTESDSAIATIVTGMNPNSIHNDANGMIWVLCGGSTGPDFTGGTADDIAGSIVKINPVTNSVESQFTMNSSDHPVKLQLNGVGNEMYYLLGTDGYTGKIVKSSINNPSTQITMIDKSFYGLAVDPTTGNLLGGFVPGFTQNGYVFRYKSDGTLMDSLECGIAPNNFAFKN
jgi:YVTN family beta-propeller protein